MSTAEQMVQLISLWALVSEVRLTDEEDSILWKWTNNGLYSAKTAYAAQHFGSYCSFDCLAIWKAKTEGKHRFFAWLMIQRKLLTADKLLTRNWPCNSTCTLCDQEPETGDHVLLHCGFAQEVWVLAAHWTEGFIRVPNQNLSLAIWWNGELARLSSEDRLRCAAYLIYAAWNLWKERNRRIFDGVLSTPSRVLQLIKDEMAQRESACGQVQHVVF
jgi:hypothetical protein